MPEALSEALRRWKAGDESAQFDLMHELRPLLSQLIRLVRAKRAADLKKRIDSHAVVNAALKSFFSGVRKSEFPVLNDSQDLARVLRMLVMRSLIDEVNRHRRARRSTDAETSFDSDEFIAPANAISDLSEMLEKIRDVLREVHPKAIDILDLRLDGMSNDAIAKELDLSLRSVQLIRQRMFSAVRDSRLE
jgi:DNA-binding NarL/FixJ family response regulator